MKVKDKLATRLRHIWGELAYGVRWLCLCPSPGKRLAAVLILVLVFGGLNIWLVVSSIYNMGKNDARKEFLELQHIRQLDLQGNDSINNQFKKQFYEYEQSGK